MKYRPKFFILPELVSKSIYDEYGFGAWDLLDEKLVRTLDDLRKFLGVPITINNWHIGGKRQQSGYRGKDSTVGNSSSQHRYGRAFDMLVQGIDSKKVRSMIIGSQQLFPHIHRMEDDVSWVHIDSHPMYGNKIHLFKP